MVGLGQGTLSNTTSRKRAARHVHAVAQGVGAQQAGILLGAEQIDQRAGVQPVDMLGIEREAGLRQRLGDAASRIAQARARR